jgi:large subunit ribosomal protein L29
MRPSDIRQLNRNEVEEQLRDKEEELSNLRLQLVTRQLENPLLIRFARRDVARFKTALQEHDLGVYTLPE